MRHAFILVLIFGLLLATVPAAQRNGSVKEAESQASKASQVFQEIMDTPDKGIPQVLIDNAECIAVFPSVVKVGFIFGGRGGKGLVSCRDKKTRAWGTPLFLKIGGVGFGLQLGAEAVDLVLVVMNPQAADLFRKGGRLELGGEASASAGPVGRTAAAETDLPTLRSKILSYSRSRGLFAGLEIKGSVITRDDKLNRAVYGTKKSDQTILDGTKAPAGVRTFAQTLTKYAPEKAK